MASDKSDNESLKEFTTESRIKFKEKSKALGSKNSTDDLVGKTYQSDEEIQNFIQLLEKQTGENYYQRDVCNKDDIKNDSRRIANKSISYRFIKYMCVHSKLKPKLLSTSNNNLKEKKSRKTFTMRSNCDAEIQFTLSKDGKNYILSFFRGHKGHEVLSNCRDLLKQNRKLSSEQLDVVRKGIEVKGSKLKIMSTLMKDGKRPILRDISNISYAMKQAGPKNDLQRALQFLKDNDAVFEVKYNEEQIFQALLFFTKDMKSSVIAWPEFFLIDSTYQLLQLEYPIVVLAVIDGNGCTEIAAVAIVVHENEDTFNWIISKLKVHYEQVVNKIKAFMSDKDHVARKVIKELLHVPTYLCTFHVQQSFRRAVNCQNMGISAEERDSCLNLMQKMVYAVSEEQYNNYYDEFCAIAPTCVLTYFNTNWHNICHDWVKCYRTTFNFNNDTNNRIESLNQKLKLFLNLKSFLCIFITEFFDFLKIHTNDRNNEAACTIYKQPLFHMSSDEKKYYNYLTKYAYDFVSKEIGKIHHVKFITCDDNITYSIMSTKAKNIKYTVTSSTCTCIDFLSMMLPCRHLLKIRSILQLSLFAEEVCNKRWSKSYFIENHRLFASKQEVSERAGHSRLQLRLPKKDMQKQECSSENCVIVAPYKDKTLSQQWDAPSQNCASGLPINAIGLPKLRLPKQDVQKQECSSENCVIVPPYKNKTLSQQWDAPSQNCASKDVLETSDLEPLIKKRGRPKGSHLNAIGLPKKRKENFCEKFISMSDVEKAYVMLEWLVPVEVLRQKVLGINKITTKDLTNDLCCWFFNEEIDLNVLKPFMDSVCFEKLLNDVAANKESVFWICDVCKNDLNQDRSISCDRCLKWFHFNCIRMKRSPPKNAEFFCNSCQTL